MLIMNQNKDKIIDTTSMIISIKDENSIIAYSTDHPESVIVVLGKFTTKDRTLEVLNSIFVNCTCYNYSVPQE